MNGTCGTSGTQNCLPNLDNYAEKFALSDRTFELRASPSWSGHMILGSATIQHFRGDNPIKHKGDPGGPGWGCDAGRTTPWYLSGNKGATVLIPSCVPDQTGSLGPDWASYSGIKAAYVPTIFDRMDAAGVSWKIYGGGGATARVSGYSWQVCPTFWECLGSAQVSHLVSNLSFTHDASAGLLPAVSLVTPATSKSAHQPASVSAGDAWVGKLVSAVMQSPTWSSTAIFVTFDDCGCFQDHVNPLAYSPDWGVRLPMVIISPYARAGSPRDDDSAERGRPAQPLRGCRHMGFALHRRRDGAERIDDLRLLELVRLLAASARTGPREAGRRSGLGGGVARRAPKRRRRCDLIRQRIWVFLVSGVIAVGGGRLQEG